MDTPTSNQNDPSWLHLLWERIVKFLTSVPAVIAGVTALIGAGAALRSLLASDSSSTPRPPPVKIGAIYPTSGVDGKSGRDTYNGVKFAIRYINHNGGIPNIDGLLLPAGKGLPNLDGADLQPVPADAMSDRCTAEQLVNKLVRQDNVSALIGAWESTITLAALRAVDRLKKVPLVNEAATAPSLTKNGVTRPLRMVNCDDTKKFVRDPKPSDWFFSVGPNDEQAAGVFRDFLYEQQRVTGKRISKIAVIHETNDIYGDNAYGVTKRKVGDELRNVDVKDFPYHRHPTSTAVDYEGTTCSPEEEGIRREFAKPRGSARLDLVESVKKFDPDVIFVASYTADAILLVQAMAHAQYQIPPMLAYGAGFATKEFIKQTQDKGRCGYPSTYPPAVITRTAWSPKMTSKSRDAKQVTALSRRVAALFQREYGEPMTADSARGFMAMLALAAAINEAGATSLAKTPSPDEIRSALENLKVGASQTIMPWGGIDFDDASGNTKGQNVLAGVVLEQMRPNGTAVVVYPRNRRTEPPIWPG